MSCTSWKRVDQPARPSPTTTTTTTIADAHRRGGPCRNSSSGSSSTRCHPQIVALHNNCKLMILSTTPMKSIDDLVTCRVLSIALEFALGCCHLPALVCSLSADGWLCRDHVHRGKSMWCRVVSCRVAFVPSSRRRSSLRAACENRLGAAFELRFALTLALIMRLLVCHRYASTLGGGVGCWMAFWCSANARFGLDRRSR